MSASAPSDNPKTIESWLLNDKFQATLADVCAPEVRPRRLARIALAQINRNPRLGQCTPRSFLSAVLECAVLGLEPDAQRGLASLVPRKDQCAFVLGYRGIIQLAYRSGYVQALDAQVVHASDQFNYCHGSNPELMHFPTYGDDPGPPVAAYAYARLLSGGQVFRVLSKSEIESARPQRWQDTPWGSNEPSVVEAMWRKTALLRLANLLPLPEAVRLDRPPPCAPEAELQDPE